jgi:hypothetical protein
MYSTGGTTGINAANILKLTQPPPPAKPKLAATKTPQFGAMIGSAIHEAGAWLNAMTVKTTKIEVLIDKGPKDGKPSSTDFFYATYGGSAGGHYEGMKQYLPTLVENSQNLK